MRFLNRFIMVIDFDVLLYPAQFINETEYFSFARHILSAILDRETSSAVTISTSVWPSK